jgi:hypothetical protein
MYVWSSYFVSARTNKRHHHHPQAWPLSTSCRPWALWLFAGFVQDSSKPQRFHPEAESQGSQTWSYFVRLCLGHADWMTLGRALRITLREVRGGVASPLRLSFRHKMPPQSKSSSSALMMMPFRSPLARVRMPSYDATASRGLWKVAAGPRPGARRGEMSSREQQPPSNGRDHPTKPHIVHLAHCIKVSRAGRVDAKSSAYLSVIFLGRASPRTHLRASMRGACAVLVLLASTVLGTHGSRSTATAYQPPSHRLSPEEDDGHLSSLGQGRRFQRRLAIAPQVTIEAYRLSI